MFYLLSLFHGLLGSINSMLNVKAGACLGPAKGALINYAEASIISLILIFVSEKKNFITVSHILSVPPFLYLGSICGLAAMVLIIIGTPKNGAFLSSVLLIIGSMSTAMILDYIFFDSFSWQKVFGIILVITGVAWKEYQASAKNNPQRSNSGD